MSGGFACRDKTHRPDWVVTQWRCNYSAFSGYRRTPSDYSQIRCLRCGKYWRTKSAYADRLRNATDEERTRIV